MTRGRVYLLIVPALLLALSSSASAAARPTLTVLGIPHGSIAGQSLPYVETDSVVQLAVGYGARLPAGSKLQLLVKVNSISAFKATSTKVKLVGGHGKVHISQGGIGGPYKYEIALVSGARHLAASKPVTIYWTRPPGGVFAIDGGGGSAYTSLTVPTESCAVVGACKTSSGSGVQEFATANSGTAPIPPGWSVTLLFNGQQVCRTIAIDGECGALITYPSVSTPTTMTLTGEVTSPKGLVTSATLLVTVYP